MLIKLSGHYWTKILIYLLNNKRTTKTFSLINRLNPTYLRRHLLHIGIMFFYFQVAVILTFKENSLCNSLLPLYKE